MKIALSTDQMSPGGGQKYLLMLGKALVKAGHSVTVVALTQGEWWSQLAANNLGGYCPPPKPHASFVQRARQLADDLNRQDFDILLVNVGKLNRLALYACHLVADHTAVIFVLHGDWRELYALSAQNIAVWNCAVAVSPKVHQEAAARFPQKPTFEITNGVEIPPTVQLTGRLDWELPLRLLFVGRLIDSHKGIFRLASILAHCRTRNLPVRLTVIGDGQDRAQLESLFAQGGVDDWVEMAGLQSPETIGAAMQRHHLFVFPTNTEGMPLVVLEAQANGCVPVVTHLPGITDVAVEHQVSGRLVEIGNITHFVDQIEAMLSPDLWRSHSQAAIERVPRLFSQTGMVEQYLALMTALAQGEYPVARPFNRTRRLGAVPFTTADYLPPYLLRILPPPLVYKMGRAVTKLTQLAAKKGHA